MDLSDSLLSIALILLGWLLGLLTPGIVDAARTSRRLRTVRKSILSELKQITFELRWTMFQGKAQLSQFDEESLNWLYDNAASYRGTAFRGEELGKLRDTLVGMTKEQLALWGVDNRQTDFELAFVYIPYFESQIYFIGEFDERFLGSALNAYKAIKTYNDMVQRAYDSQTRRAGAFRQVEVHIADEILLKKYDDVVEAAHYAIHQIDGMTGK